MKNLFSPCVIGRMALKNRIVRSATEDWLGTPDGLITTEKTALYEQLAAGGVGTIITGHAYVAHPHGRAAQVSAVEIDDRPGRIESGAACIPLFRDGHMHHVTVTLDDPDWVEPDMQEP